MEFSAQSVAQNQKEGARVKLVVFLFSAFFSFFGFSEVTQEHCAKAMAKVLDTIPSNAALGRELLTSLRSEDKMASSFAHSIVHMVDHPLLKDFPVVHAWSEIASLQKRMGDVSLEEAAGMWMEKRGVDAGLKAQFLLGQIGSGKGRFEHYLKLLPHPSDHAIVWRHIERETSYKLFYDLARESGVNPRMLDDGALESFEFRRRGFPTEGKMGEKTFAMGGKGDLEVTLTKPIEMQATPVTQLQYYIVMGDNPSAFVRRGKYKIKVNGKRTRIDPNRPVEWVSWEEAQQFIVRLNQFQDEYTYRLPTEAEWEFAAKEGGDSLYPYGASEADLTRYGWFVKNSGNKTHEVAGLRHNSLGLYDVPGNVYEWVQDLHGDLPVGKVVDPMGPHSADYGGGKYTAKGSHIVHHRYGAHRVMRGGSWFSNAENLSSVYRSWSYPAHSYGFAGVGFRVVRERSKKNW